MTHLPAPKPGKVTIDGRTYELAAFYYPGYNELWDEAYQTPFLSNFYPCVLIVTIDGISGTFQTSEAAYQATKWWRDGSIRQRFERAKTGQEAFDLKVALSTGGWDRSYGGLGRNRAMRIVVTAKFDLPAFKAGLLATGDAYLLEHNPVKGRDTYWSDDHDGSGHNTLGKMLMGVRQHLGGSSAPDGNYAVADFARQVSRGG